MHIEPGVLAAGKIVGANLVVLSVLGAGALALLKQPRLIVRSLLAATFFTLCMQAFHLKVGPSELHFLGAMPIYLAFGLVPALMGFALGLLAQAWLFEPADLLHWSVNTLSLALPLLAVHFGGARRLPRVGLGTVLRLDAAYYAGVTAMVGLWLLAGELATPLADWLVFAACYLAVVAIEPLLTVGVLWMISRLREWRWAGLCFERRSSPF